MKFEAKTCVPAEAWRNPRKRPREFLHGSKRSMKEQYSYVSHSSQMLQCLTDGSSATFNHFLRNTLFQSSLHVSGPRVPSRRSYLSSLLPTATTTNGANNHANPFHLHDLHDLPARPAQPVIHSCTPTTKPTNGQRQLKMFTLYLPPGFTPSYEPATVLAALNYFSPGVS